MSLADIATSLCDVRCYSSSGKSCGRIVRFVPEADIVTLYSITSSARESSDGGTVRPSAFAVLRLITSSYLVAA